MSRPAMYHPASRWQRAGGGLFLLAFGGVFLFFMLPEIWANFSAMNWTPTVCTILSSRVSTTQSGDGIDRETLYRLDVRYTYAAAEVRHESTRYRFVNPYTDNRAAAETAAAVYSPGATAACYVNPREAREAVLERHLSPFMLLALLPAAIAGAGLWTLIGIAGELIRRT